MLSIKLNMIFKINALLQLIFVSHRIQLIQRSHLGKTQIRNLKKDMAFNEFTE